MVPGETHLLVVPENAWGASVHHASALRKKEKLLCNELGFGATCFILKMLSVILAIWHGSKIGCNDFAKIRQKGRLKPLMPRVTFDATYGDQATGSTGSAGSQSPSKSPKSKGRPRIGHVVLACPDKGSSD